MKATKLGCSNASHAILCHPPSNAQRGRTVRRAEPLWCGMQGLILSDTTTMQYDDDVEGILTCLHASCCYRG